jgi:phytoene dehydrogenase-like protein
MKNDVIIIGSGLGGLTAGAKLARSGKRVLVLEQHDRPGGCATTFKRRGFTMEVGLHEMDGLHQADMKTRIFRDLGVTGKVEFIKVPEFYRFVNGRKDVVISHDPNQVRENLIKIFLDQEKGITSYFDQLMNIRLILKDPANDINKTLGDWMDEIITDNDLKLILLGNLGYFSDNPYKLSLNYYSMAQSSYYQGGGNFIKGGSQVLSNCLADIISSEGGEVRLKQLVTSIKTDKEKAVGVTVRDNNNQGEYEEQAEIIISNASIPSVAHKLLPQKYARELQDQLEDLDPGNSLLTVYYGFNRPLKDIGNKHYSTFIYDPGVLSLKDIPGNNRAPFTQRSFTFVDYSQLDSGLAPEGKSVGAVCCMDYTGQWNDLSDKEYRERKEEAAKAFTARLEKLIPGFSNAVEYHEVGTAMTVSRYTLNPEGAVYGFAQTPQRTERKINSPLENLHFASAWTSTGGGFSGAIFSGYLSAIDIIRKSRIK